MSQPVLRVEGLRIGVKSSPEIELLHAVSLTVQNGERVGLVGESGSGKSILSLSAIALLSDALTVTGGTVRVQGTDVVTAPERELTRLRGGSVAMIYQDPMSSLNPVQKIGRQIAEAVRAHKKVSSAAAKREAIDLLAQVGMRSPKDNAESYPHEFSGGMRQRVMIAMALAGEPQLLLADEPTTALDVTTQALILELLDRISSERGMGVLFVTHDLAVAASFCDRIAVMSQGSIVELGPSRQIVDAPQHDYTRLLLNSMCTFDSDPNIPLGQLPTLHDERKAADV